MDSAQKHSSLHCININRHAAVVLDERPLDSELMDTAIVAHTVVWSQRTEAAETEADTEFQKSQMDWVPQMTEIDDLRGPLPSSFVPFTIQRPL